MTEKNTPEERCACVGWRANACPIHGPAPLADGVTDKNSTLQAVKPLADGGMVLTPLGAVFAERMRDDEHDDEHDDECFVTCRHCGVGIWYLCPHDAAMRSRVAKLERVIEEAPHGRGTGDEPCHHRFTVCDCWKSKAKVSG